MPSIRRSRLGTGWVCVRMGSAGGAERGEWVCGLLVKSCLQADRERLIEGN